MVPMVVVTISSDWVRNGLTMLVTRPISHIRTPITSPSSSSTRISEEILFFSFSFLKQKRMTGCSMAARGIAMKKGDSLSHTCGTRK